MAWRTPDESPAARARIKPHRWRLSDQLGAPAIAAIERGVLHHPLHKLVKVMPANACEFWHIDVLILPGEVMTSMREVTCSLDALVAAEIRTANAPAAKRHMRRQR
jgi:hypothetical protein